MSAVAIWAWLFAMSISILIVLIGALSYGSLPREEYPNIAPPTVTVQTTYVGASAEVVAQNVAVPIEEAVNGATNMLYMQSRRTAAGQYALTATFAPGTNPDIDAVEVQNRVSQASGKPPCRREQLWDHGAKGVPQILDGRRPLLPAGELRSNLPDQLRADPRPRSPAAPSSSPFVAVSNGVAPGECVIVEGLQKVRPGAKVTVRCGPRGPAEAMVVRRHLC